MKEYNATLIDYGEGKGKLVVESQFGKVTFAVKADSHMWVELERPHGEWTSNRNDLEAICSVCGEALPYSDEYDYETNFCPNCGADMREGEAE